MVSSIGRCSHPNMHCFPPSLQRFLSLLCVVVVCSCSTYVNVDISMNATLARKTISELLWTKSVSIYFFTVWDCYMCKFILVYQFKETEDKYHLK